MGVSNVRSFKSCRTEDLLSDLHDAPWQLAEIFEHIHDKWSYWKFLFFSILDKHAPVIKVRNRNGKQDEWIDENLRELMRWRNYYRRKHYKTHNQDDWDRFRALRNDAICKKSTTMK